MEVARRSGFPRTYLRDIERGSRNPGLDNISMLTDYMFDSRHSLFLCGLSQFHGWLTFLLLFLIIRLGYDHLALLAWGAILRSYLFVPAPGATLANPLTPVNIDWVYGFSDTAAQTWMPGWGRISRRDLLA
jgi:hypothetical protein